LAAAESRLSARQKAIASRLEQLEAELAQMRVRG
jgi:hypothetical protein